MSSSDLTAPGSASYSSNTMHVGDGTWDSGRDTFLLPNLEGLNFDTMRYNGMGNRFRTLDEYHVLILGHGILAAIVFLLIIPIAIWSAKYWRSGGRKALKVHIYMQILTLFLSTVILVLGVFAVGPERSLTNPHHGIGVAIYTMIWAQLIFGWLMRRLEKRKTAVPTRVPTKVWIHKLFGRSIALLGIVQIALGLTLYGSPKVLFILYALWVAFLLLAYIALDRYYYEKRPLEFGYENAGEFYSDYGSYLSGSRTDYTEQRPPRRQQDGAKDESHWGRKLLAAGGALGAYEAYKHRRSNKREEREQDEMDEERRYEQERRHAGPPPVTPSGAPSSRTSSRPPPGVVYGAGGVPVHGHRPPPRGRLTSVEESRTSPESWEEKYSEQPEQHTWRNRLLGAGAGVGAFAAVRGIFNRRKQRENDDYYDDASSVRPPLGGHHNMVSQTDVSRVEQGQAPMSPPDDPRRQERVHMAGVQPLTPSQTPSRAPRRSRQRQSAESMHDDYDDESEMVSRPGRIAGGDATNDSFQYDDEPENTGLRQSIASMGAIAGFREWNKRRRERRERQQADRMHRQALDDEDQYDRRTSMNYPRPQDAAGRRPSNSGTLMTGGTQDYDFAGSNPELSRTNFSGRPDTHHPPLPADAGAVPSMSGIGASTVGPSVSQQGFNERPGAYTLPPPPPGPPPGGRPMIYDAPQPGSLQMPQGAVEPDPSRLYSHDNIATSSHPGRDAAAGVVAGGMVGSAATALASDRRRRGSQSDSPSRYHGRQESRNRLQKIPARRGSTASASASQVNTDAAGPSSPPVNLRVKMHSDGDRVTFQRLSEQEAEAKRASRKAERRQRRRQSSSSVLDSDVPPGSNQRYNRRGGPVRRSSDQPIHNVPPPPPLTASGTASGAGRRPSSELNLPTPPIHTAAPRPPEHGVSPQGDEGLSPPPGPAIGSGLSGSPGDAGTGTDVSAFADNRRRRRAERARRLEAARGTGGGGHRVEFQ